MSDSNMNDVSGITVIRPDPVVSCSFYFNALNPRGVRVEVVRKGQNIEVHGLYPHPLKLDLVQAARLSKALADIVMWSDDKSE